MRKLRLLLLMLALALTLCLPAAAADGPCDGVRAVWTVSQSGSIQCELTFTCTFTTSRNSLSLTLPEGAKDITVYNHPSKISGTTVEIQPEAPFSGETTIRVTYSYAAGLTRTDEAATLTLPLVPTGFGMDVGYTEFSLTLPKTYENEPEITIGSAKTTDAVYQLNDTSIEGTLSADVPTGSGLTLTLALDAGYFTAAPGPLRQFFAGWRVLIPVALLLAVLYWYLTMFRGSRRIHVRTRALPPDGMSAGDLPSLLCGAPGDCAALLAEWASLGYLEFERAKGGRVYLHALMNMGSERRGFERSFFARLFRDGATVQAGSRGFREACSAASRRLQMHWTRAVFDPRSGSPVLLRCLLSLYGLLLCLSALAPRGVAAAILSVPLGAASAWLVQEGAMALLRRGKTARLAVGGAAAAALLVLVPLGGGISMLLNLLVQLAGGAVIAFGGRRTRRGTELLEQTLGFRRYLTGTQPEQLQRLLRQDSQYFYRLLPYADALGCGAAFAARFGTARPEPCDWLPARAKTAQEFYARYAEVMAVLRAQEPAKKR